MAPLPHRPARRCGAPLPDHASGMPVSGDAVHPSPTPGEGQPPLMTCMPSQYCLVCRIRLGRCRRSAQVVKHFVGIDDSVRGGNAGAMESCAGGGRVSVRVSLIFVHGIGRLRDAVRDQQRWSDALAEGARRAGHSAAATRLTTTVVGTFVDYSDLMRPSGAQGGEDDLTRDEARFLFGLVTALMDELAEDVRDSEGLRALGEARAQLDDEGMQGAGALVRALGAALTTVLRVPGLRHAGQWASGNRLLGALAQVGRYLRRQESVGGRTLDERVRERVLTALPADRPAVVVGHSLGSVVVYEALHRHSGPVPLLVTLGSPLATMTVVADRVRPRPLATAPTVERWLNFWDRDDIVVARPRLDKLVKPNALGVRPESARVDSDGLWVHTATKYLAQPAVAGPIIEACCG